MHTCDGREEANNGAGGGGGSGGARFTNGNERSIADHGYKKQVRYLF